MVSVLCARSQQNWGGWVALAQVVHEGHGVLVDGGVVHVGQAVLGHSPHVIRVQGRCNLGQSYGD